MTLAFQIEPHGATTLIRLTGRIDRDAGTVLEQAYTAALTETPTTLELDFTDVDYINSTGIAHIVGVLARARAARLPMRATGLTPHYIHIFEITRLSDFIEVAQPATVD